MAVLGTLTGGGGGEGDTPSGTKVTFAQTVAPTGWVKDVTHHDKAIRVVSGTASNGGAQSFTTVFGSGKSTASHTLSSPQMPSHAHGTVPGWSTRLTTGGSSPPSYSRGAGSRGTNSAGGSGSHSHSLSLDIQYVDVIIASKD